MQGLLSINLQLFLGIMALPRKQILICDCVRINS